MQEASPQERIWQVVAAIPDGRVASYGQVAAMAGLPGRARMVGRTLSLLPKKTRLPWHRVVRADGRIALPPTSPGHVRQSKLLRAEGVAITNGRVVMRDCCWRP